MDLLKDKKKLEEVVKQVFEQIDANGNGSIEFSEMKKAVEAMYENTGVNRLSDEQMDEAILKLDQDNNKMINQSELFDFLRAILKQSVPEYTSDNEGNEQTPKQSDKNGSSTFRTKKVLTREEKKQELLQMKKDLKQLKQINQNSKQLQNQKIVNVFLNPNTDESIVKEKQKLFDASKSLQSLSSPASSKKSSVNLNPLVLNQQIRQGFFKNADDILNAQSQLKNNQLIGVAVKRLSAGEWQGIIDYFNEVTEYEFDRTPSSQQFNIISQKLSKNIKFILIHIQKISYTNILDLKIKNQSELTRTDKPALFFWEIQYNQQSYFKNSAKELVNQQNECLDTIFTYNYINPIEVILWKKQGKDSEYIGQFDITPKMIQLMNRVVDKKEEEGTEKTNFKLNLDKIKKSLLRLESQEILLYKKKRISYIKKEQEIPFQGEIKIKFQFFQIFEYDAPLNQISNTVGSPRSQSERERRLLVENSKFGPYEWPQYKGIDNNATAVLIIQAGEEIEIITDQEQIKEFLDGYVQTLKEVFDVPNEWGSGGRAIVRRKKNAEKAEATIILLKSMDEEPLVLRVDNFRSIIRKGRVPKVDLDAILLECKCSASQIFIEHVDDLGYCEIDYCFDEGNYSAIIDTVQNLDFQNPDEVVNADIFAEKLVQNIKNTLVEGIRTQPLFEFLKVAEKIPDFGITISLIADQFTTSSTCIENADKEKEIIPGAFLAYFDINSRNFEKMENYEHVMVLGKITKIAKKYLKPDNPFLKHLQTNYEDVKTKIYFTVPVLPKKMKLRDKKNLLILQSENYSLGSLMDMKKDENESIRSIVKKLKKQKEEEDKKKQEKKDQQQEGEGDENQEPEDLKPCLWNIAHELVRRRRWKMFYDGFEACPDFFYQQGASGNAPLMDFFEKAPFDVQNQTVIRFHPNNPNEELKDSSKLDIVKILDMKTHFGKSYIHALSLNTTGNFIGQATMMKTFSPLIDPDAWEQMLLVPMKPHDCTPLALLINKLSSNLINPNEEQALAVKEMIQLLKEPIEKKFNFKPFEYRAKQFLAMHQLGYDGDPEQELELQNYYFHHQQLAKAIAQNQPEGIKLILSELKWIEWFGPNLEKYNKNTTDVQFAIFNLARQGKLSYLEEILEDFQKKQSTMACVIQPKSDFIISNFQNKFIEKENDQISIFDEKEEQNISYNEEEMVAAMAQFYAKYPLEVFIGIQECLNDAKFTTQKLNKLLKTLILTTIQMEPRILAKQFYRKTLSTPYEDLVKLGFEEDINKILDEQQINAFAPRNQDLAKNIFKKAFKNQLKNEEEPLKFDYKQAREFYKSTRKMMTEKSLDEVLRFLRKLETDKIPGRETISKRLATQIATSLPDSFSKAQYPKIFQALRQQKINDGVIKLVLNAALLSNNQQLVNQCLLHLWNPKPVEPEEDASKPKKVSKTPRTSNLLKPLYQKFGQFAKALQYHPAVILNDSDYQKYLQDTKDVATIQDYEVAAEALIKQGLPQRLPALLEKFAQSNPAKVANLLDEIALNQLERILIDPPIKPIKPVNGVFTKMQPMYIVPTKKQIILSQQNLIDAGAVGCLLQNAINAFQRKPAYPKNYSNIINHLSKQAYSQLYLQKLRQNYYNQNPGSAFNNTKLPEPQVDKVVQLLADAIKDKIDNIEIKDKLEKIYLLPLISKSYDILEKFENRNSRIFTSIEKIVLFNLKLHPTQQELERIQSRVEQNLVFIDKFFNPKILDIMQQDKNRTLRILRALDYTLKKSSQAVQLKFAGDVSLILVKNFKPSDFDNIIESDTSTFFNAIAVALLRSKTIDQKALDFMGTQLNKYEFYDLIFELSYDKQKGNNKNAQISESKIFNSLETLPNKAEIESAAILIVPSQNNLQYILKLLKAKVKPFFKSYKKEKNFVNGIPFGFNDLKELPLFEYLIAKCQYTLISKYYITVFKPKKQLTEEQIKKYLCLAASSGSYTLFDLITEQILGFKLSVVYKLYHTNQQLQVFLDQPIFYQVLMYSSEESSILYFNNIITEGTTQDLFFKWMNFSIEDNDEPFEYNCFVPIIQKNYGNLFNKIINYLRILYPQKKIFQQNLLLIMNSTQFSQSEQTEFDEDSNEVQIKLTLLEYSIQQGFPDFGMIFQPDMDLIRNPFEEGQYLFIKNCLATKSKWMPDDENTLLQYIKKNENDAQNYRVNYYKMYLLLKKYMNFDKLLIGQRIQSSLLLFKLFMKYKPNLCIILNAQLIENLQLIGKKQTYIEQFEILHFSGFDKVYNCKMPIIDYIQKFHQPIPVWAQKEVIDGFQQYLGFQIRNSLKDMVLEEPEEISDFLEQLTYEVLMYILYNNQDLFLHPAKNNQFFYFNYNFTLPILRQLSANQKEFEEKILGEKQKDKLQRQKAETEQQQEYYDLILKKFDVEEVETNYKFAAILFMYLGQCNDRIQYVGEEVSDKIENKIFKILTHLLESFSIQQLDNYVVHLIQSLRNNQIYQIVMQWTADTKKGITRDIMSEKNFIQGILNLINKLNKSEKSQINYQQNELLKLFQFEFSRTDKLSRDKIYRGLCIIHIALNLLQETQFLNEQIDTEDKITINIEMMEFSKAKKAEMRIQSVKDILESYQKIGFEYQIAMPMIYQERNNQINLSFPLNVIKDFKSNLQKKRIAEIDIVNFLAENDKENQQPKIIAQIEVFVDINKNMLLQNVDIFTQIQDQMDQKLPFQIGKQLSILSHEIDLDADIFVQDDPKNIIANRKLLAIEDEVRIQSYLDVTKYQHQMHFDIKILKKDLYFQKCKKETQIKLLLDDFVKKIKRIKQIDQQQSEQKEDQANNIINQQFEWPVCMENDKIITDDCNIPIYFMRKIISIIDAVFSDLIISEGQKQPQIEKKYLINYYSFIETLILWQAKTMELQKKSNTSDIPIESIVFQALQWPMLHYTMETISKLIAKSNILFEMKEVCKPSVMPQIQGIDDSILLSQTQYFNYKGMIVIRLGVFYNKKILQTFDRTTDQNLRFSQNFAMNSNIEPYTKYVINEQQISELLQSLQEKQS